MTSGKDNKAFCEVSCVVFSVCEMHYYVCDIANQHEIIQFILSKVYTDEYGIKSYTTVCPAIVTGDRPLAKARGLYLLALADKSRYN